MVKLQVTKLIHRNLLHFYIPTTKDQKEKFRKQFHLPSQTNKQTNKPKNKLPKQTKDLYSANCKTLVKEIEEDTNR